MSTLHFVRDLKRNKILVQRLRQENVEAGSDNSLETRIFEAVSNGERVNLDDPIDFTSTIFPASCGVVHVVG